MLHRITHISVNNLNKLLGYYLATGLHLLGVMVSFVLPTPLVRLVVWLSRFARLHPRTVQVIAVVSLTLLLTACSYQPYQPTVVKPTNNDSFAGNDNNQPPEVSSFQKVVISLCNTIVEAVVGIANSTFSLAYNFSVVNFTQAQTTCATAQPGNTPFDITTAPTQIVAVWSCGATSVWHTCIQLAADLLELVVAYNFLRNLIDGLTTSNNFKTILRTIISYAPILAAINNADLILTFAFDFPMRMAASIKGDPFAAAGAILQSLYKVSLHSPPDFNVVVVGSIFGLFYSYYILWLSWRYFIRLILAYFCFAVSPLALFSLTTKESKRFFYQWLGFLTPLVIAPMTVGVSYALSAAVLNTNINSIPDPYSHGYSWAISMMFAIIMLAFANKMMALTVGPVGQAADGLLRMGIGTITSPVRNLAGGMAGAAGQASGNLARRGGGLVVGGLGAGIAAVSNVVVRRKTPAERESSSSENSGNGGSYSGSTTSWPSVPMLGDEGLEMAAMATANNVSANSQVESGQQWNALISEMHGVKEGITELTKLLANSAANNNPNSSGGYAATPAPIWIQNPNGGNGQNTAFPTIPLYQAPPAPNSQTNPNYGGGSNGNNGNAPIGTTGNNGDGTSPMGWPTPYAPGTTSPQQPLPAVAFNPNYVAPSNGATQPNSWNFGGMPHPNENYQYPPRSLPAPHVDFEGDWGLPPMLPPAPAYGFAGAASNYPYGGNNNIFVSAPAGTAAYYGNWPRPDQMPPSYPFYPNPNGNAASNKPLSSDNNHSEDWGINSGGNNGAGFNSVPTNTYANNNSNSNPIFYPAIPQQPMANPSPTNNGQNNKVGNVVSNNANNNGQANNNSRKHSGGYAEIEIVAARFRYTAPNADMLDPYSSEASSNVIEGTARPVPSGSY